MKLFEWTGGEHSNTSKYVLKYNNCYILIKNDKSIVTIQGIQKNWPEAFNYWKEIKDAKQINMIKMRYL